MLDPQQLEILILPSKDETAQAVRQYFLPLMSPNKGDLEMTIKKVCKTLRQAEKTQESLYNKYDSVKLVKSPTMFSEAGEYIWEVK